MLRISTVFLLIGMAWTAQAQPLERVVFGTNWVAEAEHGGFYQALADGTYKKYGLEVIIVPGGPNVNNRTQLLAGKLDFFMSANSLQSFDAVANNIPTVVVAAAFQKDPQVFVAHPDVTKFDDLKTRTLFVSKEGMTTYFQWLKSEFGFNEAKVKPYTFNAQPFLADKNSAMQGYVTSEPFAIEREAGFKPVVFLLADQGFDAYSTLIETRRELVEKKSDMVKRFVDASAIGWYHYIYGDGRPGNQLIKIQNPEMTDGLLAYSVDKMKAARHRGFRRLSKARDRGHDRRPLEKLFRQDGACGSGEGGYRLQARLHTAVCQQRCRHGSASEELTISIILRGQQTARNARAVCSRRTTSQPNSSIAANTVSDPPMANGSPTS